MQVLPVSNKNTNFGNINGIKYSGDFGKYPKKCMRASDALLNNEAFKVLGQTYHFIANFHCHLRENAYFYELNLWPDDKKKITPSWVKHIHNTLNQNKSHTVVVKAQKKPKLPNLPIDVLVSSSFENNDKDSFNDFIEQIKNTTVDTLQNKLQLYLKSQ